MLMMAPAAPMMMAAVPTPRGGDRRAGRHSGVRRRHQPVALAADDRLEAGVRVRGPGFINYNLARLGERLVQRGRSTIETVQQTELGASLTQTGGGIATLSTTSGADPGPPRWAGPGWAPQAQPPASPQSEGPQPSPQCQPSQKHLFHKHSSN